MSFYRGSFQEERMKQKRDSPELLPDNELVNNNADEVLNSPVRGRHGLYEPDDTDGGSPVHHDLQEMHDARLPEYDRNSTMDTYIQSYLDVRLSRYLFLLPNCPLAKRC
jgi:hypothetical protein